MTVNVVLETFPYVVRDSSDDDEHYNITIKRSRDFVTRIFLSLFAPKASRTPVEYFYALFTSPDVPNISQRLPLRDYYFKSI